MTELLGILDLGSNSVMLTVGKVENGIAEQIKEFYEVTKLGENLTATNVLNKAAMTRTIATAQKFMTEGKALGITKFIATATSAVRDASNGNDFIKRVLGETGVEPQLLSGHEEADLVFRGATLGLPAGELVITADPGGGSTEINIGYVGQDPFYGKSFQAGCVRQADMFDLYETVTAEQLKKARNSIQKELKPAFEQKVDAVKLVISGGTSTSYSAMDQELLEYTNEAVHHKTCTLDKLDQWIKKLFSMTSNERGKLQGLDPSRAPMLPTGLLIMSEVIKGFGLNEFVVTTTALRQGILQKHAEQNSK